MKRVRIMGLCLVASLPISAVVAGAAQAVTGGPIWLEAGKVPLTGTKNIAKVAGVSANQMLESTAVSVECPSVGVKAGEVNTIDAGNPGTDAATIVFKECHVTGSTVAECAVKGGGGGKAEVIVKVKTVLGYKVAEATPIYDQLFPNAETSGGKDLFVTLEFEGSNCGTLKGKKITVDATGSEAPKPVGFGNRKCGMIAEVGKINAKNEFEAAKSGELVKLGGLKLPTTAITEEKVWNSETKVFQSVKCKLEAGETAATQSGTVSVELESGAEFGVEI